MIVLGIAALILAGVLIAVPALQRNQRNNNRRADISYVQAQLTAYQGSNQNALPTTAAQVANGVTNNDDESAYYAANNSWDAANDWNLELSLALGVDGGAAEYNLWVDGLAANGTINADAAEFAAGDADNTDPGAGSTTQGDPLPDEEHFDVFIGYRCTISTLSQPGGNQYPNRGTAYNPATNVADPSPTYADGALTAVVPNLFVNEDGRARDFAIVYRLEGEDVWRCQDNT